MLLKPYQPLVGVNHIIVTSSFKINVLKTVINTYVLLQTIKLIKINNS